MRQQIAENLDRSRLDFAQRSTGRVDFARVDVDSLFASFKNSDGVMAISSPLDLGSSQATIRDADLSDAVVNNHDLINQLLWCSQTRFTGQLTVNLQIAQTPHWDLYFDRGRLVTGTSSFHPIRRWCRQFFYYNQNLDGVLVDSRLDPRQPWDYQRLIQLVRQDKLTPQQMAAMVEGAMVEILFDLIQVRHQHAQAFPLQLTQRPCSQQRVDSALIGVRPALVIQQAIQAWKVWCEAGLENYWANHAPVIWDSEELRRQTSLLVYCNLMKLLDGDRTLRDLAIRRQQDLAALTQSIRPYIDQDIIGLVEVKDWVYWRPPNGIQNARSTSPDPSEPALQARASSPMVVYVEDNRFDGLAMGKILDQTGCRFVNIREPLQALPLMLEYRPDLIFLDLQMPVMNGFEICIHIRRVSMFREIPIIIVTSSDGLVDRMRAKLVGATGFIAKPIESEKVLTTLQQHLALF